MWRLILIFIVACGGFWLGTKKRSHSALHIAEDHSLVDYKPFVVIVYAHNQNLWCERTLTSIFEQEYEHYRVIFVDDGSLDQTLATARNYVVENQQQNKTIVIHNDHCQGIAASLQRALDQCLDKELVVFLHAKDWFAHTNVLNRMNRAFQNPQIALVRCQTIAYPSYAMQDTPCGLAFYATELKQVFEKQPAAIEWEERLSALVDKRRRDVLEPLVFANTVQ